MKSLICIFTFFVLYTFLSATIINVPADQPTIQAGIDAATDADTVLVQPGTYVENINYNEKLITVASLFLTTQDTTYISQTVIDGNQNGSVVTFESGEDSTAFLTGFTITNGLVSGSYPVYYGGGISFRDNSSPSLANVTITGNSAVSGGGILCYGSSPSLTNVTITGNSSSSGWHECGGGGIYLHSSSPSLINVTITGNSANAHGGGIRCQYSSPSLVNVTITDNCAVDYYYGGSGGGIYCTGGNPSLENVTIADNSANGSGGGIYCAGGNPSLINVTISGNTANIGGGIRCQSSSPSLMDVTISGNTAIHNGGGIYCIGGSPSFDAVDRCNIFLNFAGLGCDLYASDCPTIDVIVDTFTILQPDDYFAYPIDNFTFDILNAKVEQINQDLYVSPDGSDENSGLTVDDPLLTVNYALTKILPDSTNPLTIHLSNGTYSPSVTSEIFPSYCRSYVSLLGEDEAFTILDGEGMSNIIFCYNDNNFSIENMTIQNGNAFEGGGIYCIGGSPSLNNVTITGNSAGYYDGGISCRNNSNPSLVNVTITGNSANSGGGICCITSSSSLVDVTITGNITTNYGGGIYCYQSNPCLVNVTITGNSASYGGGIYSYEASSPSLTNCIVWNDSPQEIYFAQYNNPNSITISYSDIQNGEAGIVTNNSGIVNWLEGNIDDDPIFIGTGDHPFMLQDLSPCVNAGIPDTTSLNLPEFDLAGNSRVYGGRIDMGAYENQNVVVSTNENLIPLITKLNQNYPNPFNPTTTINYSLKENGKVSLNIYNIKGQKVKQLVSNSACQLSAGQLSAGQHSVIWNGKDDNNKSVASGIYFYKLKTDNFEKTKKMILLR